ncbi:plasmid replication protein, partial [Pseudomonas aeruginosa]
LLAHRHSLSHFTPNPYVSYTYSDIARKHITGFSEENLLQLNTFVVDIDTKRYSVQELVLTAMDESIGVPTLVV